MIAEAVRELGEDATHEDVARRTGIPIGFLQWAYPTLDDLRRGRHVSSLR
jgi:hypothetical protein